LLGSAVLFLASFFLITITSVHAAGIYDSEWGGNGSGPGQFNYVTGVAVDPSGKIYCGDADNNRVRKFTADGDYITQWGTYGGGQGQFDAPYSPEYGGGQYIFVIDEWNHRVQKFVPIRRDYIEPVSFGEIKASVK
jgi:DNA-binding beta-propeller fold protein YncE